MLIKKLFILIAFVAISASYGQQIVVNCYPHLTPSWTGACTVSAYTQSSWIYAIGAGGQRGYAMFDVSAIPGSAIINDIKLHFYVNTSSYNPYYLITKLSINPIESPPSSVFNQIGLGTTSINSNTYYLFNIAQPSNIWKTFTLNVNAKNDMQYQLLNTSPAWFGIGYFEYENNSIYWMNVHGWNQPNIPYLEVTYTTNFPVDIGLESISPHSPLCAGVYPLKFVVKNYGSGLLNTATINWSVNGVNQAVYNWTKPGGLASGAADTVVMTTYDFSTGPVTIYGNITNPNGVNDPNAINNSKTNIIQVITLPAITVQPTDITTTIGGDAIFEVQASGGGISYLWQSSATNGSTWFDVPSLAPYSYVYTNALHISNVPFAMSGYRYRCIVDGSCLPIITSNVVTLIVGDAIQVKAGTGYACPGETSLVPITIKNVVNISSFTITLNYNPANITYNTYLNLSSSLSSGNWNTTATGGKIQMTWSSATPITIASGKICDLQLTFISGLNNLIWDTLTPGNCSFITFTSIDFPADYINGPFSNASGIITQQPNPILVGINETAKFWVSATGMPAYQWQRSTNGGVTWTNLVDGPLPGGNGASCSGAATDTLKVLQCQTIINLNRFRCALAMCTSTVISINVQIQVIKRVITRIDSAWKCVGDLILVPVRVWNFDSVASMSLVMKYLPASLSFTGYQNVHPNIVNFIVNGTISGQVRMAQYVVANVNIPDGGTLVELKFIYTGGCTYLKWDTATVGNCEYDDLYVNPLPSVFYSGAICDAKAVVTLQPIASSIYEGGNTAFTIAATGHGALTYQWQASANGGLNWVNIANNTNYSGATTSILTLAGIPIAFNTYKYKCIVSGQCPPTASNAVILTVNPQPIYLTAGTLLSGLIGTAANNSCEQDTVIIPIHVQNCNNICSFNLKLDFDPLKLTFQGWRNLNTGLSQPANFTCTVSGGNQVVLNWASGFSASPGNGILVILKFLNTGGIYNGNSLAWHQIPTGSSQFSNCSTLPINTLFNNGIVNILPLPIVYNISPVPLSGHYCFGNNGVQLNLDFSQVGVNYQIYKNGAIFSSIASIPGTGQGFSFGNLLLPGTYTCMATMGNSSCLRAMDGQVTVVVDTLAQISGTVKYDNAIASSLVNATLVLKNSSNAIVDNTISAVPTGTYTFRCLAPDTYTIEASTTRAWDLAAANSTDALMIAKASVGSITLSAFRQVAGDVNLSGYLNSADALYVMKRFVGTVSSFPSGNWVWNIPNPIAVASTNLTKNIQALMTGDVNGSYTPSIPKTSLYSMETNGQLTIPEGSETALPIKIRDGFEASALSLVIDFPSEKIEITDVDMKLDGALWNVVYGEFRLAWYCLVPHQFAANETLFSLKIKAKSFTEINKQVSLSFGNESLLSDSDGNDIEDVVFLIPEIKIGGIPELTDQASKDGYFLSQNSPNPFDKFTQIEYTIPENGFIQLYISNILGERIYTLINEQQQAGNHSVNFEKDRLAKGVYFYRIQVTDEKGIYEKTRVMILR